MIKNESYAQSLYEKLCMEKFPKDGILGISLPGSWRPFNDRSPWNTPIPLGAKTHPDSQVIINAIALEKENLGVVKRYQTPIWVVDSKRMRLVKLRSDKIFDHWDQDHDGWSDVGVPVTPEMWGEPTEDGQICVVDPYRNILWDISSYRWEIGPGKCYPLGTTFDLWDLLEDGVADPPEGSRWTVRGGRGSGFPGIAGVLRPEELQEGHIRHALVFTHSRIRKDEGGGQLFIPPACRSDGEAIGKIYPIMGMRFQLDPTLTEKDFKRWGLSREGIIIARALQEYGMYLGIGGAPMKIVPQLLAPTPEESESIWNRMFPGIFKSIEKIPNRALRVVYTGEPRVRIWKGKKRE